MLIIFFLNITHPATQKQDTDIYSQHWKTKWATFTCSRKETRKVTTVQGYAEKITFRMQNTIQNIAKHQPRTDK
jgi:hypothetical protein